MVFIKWVAFGGSFSYVMLCLLIVSARKRIIIHHLFISEAIIFYLLGRYGANSASPRWGAKRRSQTLL